MSASDKVVRAAARSLPQEHAAALLAVAVLHIHQRPGGNAKLCVAAKELMLAHGASFELSEGVRPVFLGKLHSKQLAGKALMVWEVGMF